MATAAYAPESIRAHAVNPSDFDNFWEGTLKEARQVPLSSTMELLPSRCTETVNVYQSVSKTSVKARVLRYSLHA